MAKKYKKKTNNKPIKKVEESEANGIKEKPEVEDKLVSQNEEEIKDSTFFKRIVTKIQVIRNLMRCKDRSNDIPNFYVSQTIIPEVHKCVWQCLKVINKEKDTYIEKLCFGNVHVGEQAILQNLACVIVPIDATIILDDYLQDSFSEMLYRCQAFGTKVIFGLTSKKITEMYYKEYYGRYPVCCIGIPKSYLNIKEVNDMILLSKQLRKSYIDEYCSYTKLYPNNKRQNPLWIAAYYGLTVPNIIYNLLKDNNYMLYEKDHQYQLTPLGIAYERKHLHFIELFSRITNLPLNMDLKLQNHNIIQILASYLASHNNLLYLGQPNPNQIQRYNKELHHLDDDYSTLNLIINLTKMNNKSLGLIFFNIIFNNSKLFDNLMSKVLPPHHRRVAWAITRWALISLDLNIFSLALSYYNLRWSLVLYNHINSIQRSNKNINVANRNKTTKEKNGESLLLLACKNGLEKQALMILIHIIKAYATKSGTPFQYSTTMVINDVLPTPADDKYSNALKDILPLEYFYKKDLNSFTALDYAIHHELDKVLSWFDIYIKKKVNE